MNGKYPIYGAAGQIGTADFYHQEKPYVAVVKDGAGIGRTMLLPAYSSVIGTLQYLIPKDNVLPAYLCYVVQHMRLAKYFSGATIPHIYFRDYKNEEFNLVSIDQQRETVLTLDKIQGIISHRRAQLAKLDELVKCRFVELFGDIKINPRGWNTETIDTVTREIIGGVSLNGEHREMKDGERAVLKVSAVTYGCFRSNEYKVINNEIPISKYIFPQKGDLLFSRANTKELVGATALVDKDYPNLLLPDKIWKIVTSEKVSPVYLKFYLSAPGIRDLMSKSATGTSGSMYNISMEKLRKIPVLLPPLALQTAFADFVRRVDKSRFAIQASLDKTQQLFDSLMQEYFG